MKILFTFIASTLLLFNVSVLAQSQCVGLSKSQCSANKSCSWRKSSVNKNNVKTKAHCRALPNKAKAVAKKKVTKKTATKKTATKKTATKKKATKK